MKKKNLFVPILTGTTAVGTIAAITSCSCFPQPDVKNNIEAADIDVTIIGNNLVAYWQFTLDKPLATGQKLEVTYSDPEQSEFTFGDLEVKNRLVTIPIYWFNTEAQFDKHDLIEDLTFTCSNSAGSPIWTQTIENAKVTYLPYCTIDSDKKTYIAQEADLDNKTITATYVFNLPNGMPKGYPCRLEVQVNNKDSSFAITESNIQIELNESKTQATIKIPATKQGANAVGDGDAFRFDMQVYCMYGTGADETDIPIWISGSFLNMSCYYKSEMKEIPTSMMHFEPFGETGTYCTLSGIDPLAFNGDYNTLTIPVKAPDGRKVIQVGSGSGPLLIPDCGITKLVFGGSKEEQSVLTYFGEGAFAGCSSFKFIDASHIPNQAEGLDQMVFGKNSFSGWTENGGKIIWGDEFSQYKRHMLIANLYAAGLTYANWYDITEVSTEDQLREACASGANIRLMNDITIAKREDYTGQVEITQSLVLDLNGNTITSEGPIYNYDTKDFAIFGIWNGVEVVVTDLSSEHNGEVRAFDQSDNYDKYHEDIPQRDTPETKANDFWCYCSTMKDTWKWRPREQRCFYMRNDRPGDKRTSLEILAGNYYGNCTTILNWNGVCWIEEVFKDEFVPYKYAPQFHALTPFNAYDPDKDPVPSDEGGRELLNCDDSASSAGLAYFEVWGGKFYGVEKETKPGEFHIYDPEHAAADTEPGGKSPANWLPTRTYGETYDVKVYTIKEQPIPYNLVIWEK